MLIPLEVFELSVAAMKAVIVVPMFAPMMKGAACFNVAIFFATIGTTTDVVMVLERIAAVVSKPHPKDFNSFLKKKRLNTSGDFAFSRSEISLRKISIEENSSPSDRMARKKPLGIFSIRKSIMGVNPTQT